MSSIESFESFPQPEKDLAENTQEKMIEKDVYGLMDKLRNIPNKLKTLVNIFLICSITEGASAATFFLEKSGNLENDFEKEISILDAVDKNGNDRDFIIVKEEGDFIWIKEQLEKDKNEKPQYQYVKINQKTGQEKVIDKYNSRKEIYNEFDKSKDVSQEAKDYMAEARNMELVDQLIDTHNFIANSWTDESFWGIEYIEDNGHRLQYIKLDFKTGKQKVIGKYKTAEEAYEKINETDDIPNNIKETTVDLIEKEKDYRTLGEIHKKHNFMPLANENGFFWGIESVKKDPTGPYPDYLAQRYLKINKETGEEEVLGEYWTAQEAQKKLAELENVPKHVLSWSNGILNEIQKEKDLQVAGIVERDTEYVESTNVEEIKNEKELSLEPTHVEERKFEKNGITIKADVLVDQTHIVKLIKLIN